MIETLRPGLTDLPARLKNLPIARGYPIPWFVEWIDGKPEFRIASSHKRLRAVTEHLCWVCGDRLGSYVVFVVGPMCAVNQISSDPGMHRECAEWSVKNCPFLVRPQMERRENNLPEEMANTPGFIARNPGITVMWITKDYRPFNIGGGDWLIKIGEPREVLVFREGRPANHDEVFESVKTGLPLLLAEVDLGNRDAVAELKRGVKQAAIHLHLDAKKTMALVSNL